VSTWKSFLSDDDGHSTGVRPAVVAGLKPGTPSVLISTSKEDTALRRTATVLGFLLGTVGCGGGGGPTGASTPPPAGAASPVVLDNSNFDVLVVANPQPSLVEFWHPSCSACQRMIPVVARLAADFDGRALVGTIDVDTQLALTGAHGVTAVPTFLFYKNGQEIFRQLGATTYEDLAGRLQALLAP
jgi:thioredoxin 1